jgi:hypothetical protein
VPLPLNGEVTMVLGSTQPLTEMSTRNLPGGKWRPVRKVDNINAICESTHLTRLSHSNAWPGTASY